MLLIGSQAAVVHRIDLGRTPADVDVVATYAEVEDFVLRLGKDIVSARPFDQGRKYLVKFADKAAKPGFRLWEFELAWPGTTAKELLYYAAKEPECNRAQDGGTGYLVATPGMLLALKLSHRYKKNSKHFLKTMQDIQALRKAGAKVPTKYNEWFKRREKETYSYKHPNLNVEKGAFFAGDGVKYVYDHDAIHEAIKSNWQPAYKFFQKDGAAVACDKQKFLALPKKLQLDSVIEEATVLALERSQIPHRGEVTPAVSFQIALEKVCTSITSGWWREFAWENYSDALLLHNPWYASDFFLRADAGRVALYKGSAY